MNISPLKKLSLYIILILELKSENYIEKKPFLVVVKYLESVIFINNRFYSICIFF